MADLSAFTALTPDELARRRQQAGRLLLAEGASHVMHGEAAGETDAAWEIDPIPYMLTADEWEVLAAGLIQRARLLDAVLTDVYGDQQLFAEGLLPPEAVLGYRGYVHAVARGALSGRRLLLYGADVARTAAGDFVVLRDRTDVPAGLGYALVARKVMARLSGDAFRAEQIQPHAPFFRTLRATLAAQAPADRLSPRVVILTPGYPQRHYFEHSYLAAHLGYHLAEGADLTVRAGRVWLRALGGLEPVDVVLRRIDDLTVDPLECDPPTSATIGVPGLFEALREGGVGIANTPGAAAAETLALGPYLPTLCRHLLGEALSLPVTPTLWCGDPDQRAEVLEQLDHLVLHVLEPGANGVDASTLDDADRDRWRRAIATAPHKIAAQVPVRFATSPTLSTEANEVVPGTVVMRLLVAATDTGWDALPGGLARVLADHEAPGDAPTGVTKDVWVHAHPGRLLDAWRRPRAGLPQVDLQSSLPTRVAEALYWIGRNAERAEQTARLARALLLRWEQVPELVDLGGRAWREAMLGGLRSISGGQGLKATPDSKGDLLAELDAALTGRSGGLADSLDHLLGATATVREYLSSGTWRLLGQLASERAALAPRAGGLTAPDLPALADLLDRTVVGLMALAGLEDESMTRGPGWRFLELGRRVERALLLLNLVEAVLGRDAGEPVVSALAEVVLEAHESLVVYRRRFRSDIEVDQVLELLLADETNPRSLTFSLDRLREHLAALPWRDGAEADKHLTLVDDTARALLDRRSLDTRATNGRRTDLDRLVLAARGPLLELAGRLVEAWFADRAGVPSRRWEM